jgi:hypothetical protein
LMFKTPHPKAKGKTNPEGQMIPAEQNESN